MVRWVLYTAWVVGVSVAVLEGIVRLSVSWSPGYYHGYLEPSAGVMHYPFGDIPINRHGWPDRPLEEGGSKPRIIWLGDSVLYGTGAPYGERITEHFDRLRPALDHINMGRMGYSGPRGGLGHMDQLLRAQRPAGVVYLANLNDIVPDANSPFAIEGPMVLPFSTLKAYSALYALIAQRVHEWSVASDPRHSPVEHTPEKWDPIVRQTAKRIQRLAQLIEQQYRIPFTVVLVPYEMQISEASAAYYAELGVHWEPDFVEGSTQKALMSYLPLVRVIDGREAFLGAQGRSRADNARCAYFVCDRGGRLDWNHLMPEGHALLAEYVHAQGLFAEDR